MLTINLQSSTNQDALVNAIKQATDTNAVLNLMAGPHYTKPGRNQKIAIGKQGLRIKGSLSTGEFSSIQRPNNAIDLAHSDDNYGLFFIPSPPTETEWAAVTTWKTATNTEGSYQYAVIVRGALTIENMEIDCNMGNQGLPIQMPSQLIEHSAMLGFAGQKYAKTTYPNKFIFVAFESVTLNNIRTTRGGYADDIWISRGYFRPNIGKVSINSITSHNRINAKRATVSFSGLPQKVEINNATIFKLEAEETSSRWSELPGDALTPTNQYSFWQLKNIDCEMLDLAAKGKSIFLNAQNIKTNVSTNLYQLGGTIQHATFNLLPKPTLLNRLNDLVFKKVTWLFTADANGQVFGLALRAQYGETCSAIFKHNTFKVKGSFTKGILIDSEYSRVLPENSVNFEFSNCVYDKQFGSAAFPNTYIAKAHERGHWRFNLSDFAGLPVDSDGIPRAILRNPAYTDVVVDFV